MSLLRRSPTYPTDGIRDRTAKRVSRLSEAEILAWADVTGSAIARNLRDYQRSHDEMFLFEAREGVSALQGVMDTLVEREMRAK